MSVLVEFYSAAESVMLIGRECFEPQPRVDCSMVRFKLKPPCERLSVTSEKVFLGFVQVCFSSRRKTLRNNLRAVYSQAMIASALEKTGLQENVRPQELTAADFVALAGELYE
jgi:16S rRNA (adenine1518-N6/adenine1519-N6)-dimethyltransferase